MKLLESRPMSKITVKDIVDDCGVNRNTFYYHFRDIPAMVEYIIKDESTKIYNQYKDVEYMEDCVCALIDYAVKNKKAVLNLFKSGNKDIYETYMWKNCDYLVRSFFSGTLEGMDMSEKDSELIIKYCKCGLFGQMMDWINSNMEYDMKAEFKRYCLLWPEVSNEVLKRYSVEK